MTNSDQRHARTDLSHPAGTSDQLHQKFTGFVRKLSATAEEQSCQSQSQTDDNAGRGTYGA